MIIEASLFAPQTGALTGPVAWLEGVMLGELATVLCVLAIAWVGVMMLGGRLAVRDGLQVLVGCFVLFGAPAIAAGLWSAASDAAGNFGAGPPPAPDYSPLVVDPIPPSQVRNYDPYAGASVPIP